MLDDHYCHIQPSRGFFPSISQDSSLRVRCRGAGDGRCDIDRREGGSVTGSIVASGQLGKSSWISPVAAVGRHIKPRPRRLPLMLTFHVTLKIFLYFGFTLFGHMHPYFHQVNNM